MKQYQYEEWQRMLDEADANLSSDCPSIEDEVLVAVYKDYVQHLRFAWSVSFVLFVHGLFPWVWETKAGDMIEEKRKHGARKD